ncbi:MAG: lysophospholipid acyltransferase family protein [bacterium]
MASDNKKRTAKIARDEAVIAQLDRALFAWRAHLPRSAWKVVNESIRAVPSDVIGDFVDKYQRAGRDWGFMPKSILAAEVMTAVFRHLVKGRLHIHGVRNVNLAFSALGEGRIQHLYLLCNHVSYADASLVRMALGPMLSRFGFEDDFTVVVGPKVFRHACRKFASLHFNTVQVAQSRIRATPSVALPLSEIAKAARKAIHDICHHARLVLIFPEGGRSRSGKLMPFLPGVWRLLSAKASAGILPLSIEGSDRILPVGAACLKRGCVTVRVGPMRELAEFSDGTDGMEAMARSVASLMPPAKRGRYAPESLP